MRSWGRVLAATVGIVTLSSLVGTAEAHRSGCHRWHSCPSDSGSYICGDWGYCSQCPDNQYCLNGQPRPRVEQPATPRPAPKPPPASSLGRTSTTRPALPPPTLPPNAQLINDVLVHAQPAFHSPIVAEGHRGQQVRVEECDRTWCRLHPTGWVIGGYVRKLETK